MPILTDQNGVLSLLLTREALGSFSYYLFGMIIRSEIPNEQNRPLKPFLKREFSKKTFYRSTGSLSCSWFICTNPALCCSCLCPFSCLLVKLGHKPSSTLFLEPVCCFRHFSYLSHSLADSIALFRLAVWMCSLFCRWWRHCETKTWIHVYYINV